MIFGKTKIELKVGVFVFLGLVILSVFILSIGSFKTWTSGKTYNFVFHFVNGLKLGAPVRYAGVDIGEVKTIMILPPAGQGKVDVKIGCWMRKDVKIPMDSTIWVNTLGLLGEKYVEVIPGQDFTKLLAENQSLDGVDPISMQEVTESAHRIVQDVDDIILKIKNKEGTVGKLIGDDAIYNEVDALVKDIRKHPWKLFWKTRDRDDK